MGVVFGLGPGVEPWLGGVAGSGSEIGGMEDRDGEFMVIVEHCEYDLVYLYRESRRKRVEEGVSVRRSPRLDYTQEQFLVLDATRRITHFEREFGITCSDNWAKVIYVLLNWYLFTYFPI